MKIAKEEIPTHPVEYLPEADIAALPVLPMTQSADGTWCCDGESTQDGTPSTDNPIPITNTYPAGTYKAICGDKTYKVVLDDDLRSVPGVADRVTIDAGRGKLKIEKGIGYIESYTDETVETVYMSSTGELTEGATVIYQLATPTTTQSIQVQLLTIQSGRSAQILNTVNDKADFLKVGGDSWQLMQDEIKDADGNVTQPKMPSPEYQSDINDVEGTLRSCGWNLIDIDKLPNKFCNVNGNVFTTVGNHIDWIKLDFRSKEHTRYSISLNDMNIIDTGEAHNVNHYGFQVKITYTDGTIRSIYVTQSFKIYTTLDNKTIKKIEINNPWGVIAQYKQFQICESINGKSKPYDRHRGNSITLPKLRGLPDGTRDTLCVDRRNKRAWVERKVGLVESYNGESVGDLFMSNTGELSTGAVVHYKLATPVIEELPYSDYLLEMCQYETNINFVDCNENLNPEITAIVKTLGNL